MSLLIGNVLDNISDWALEGDSTKEFTAEFSVLKAKLDKELSCVTANCDRGFCK
ncbi:hypothetical protein NIES50_40410 [Aulosira laxa NIES-50]|nr:hypothetical protein NIES50_40410 [Aulosira laxa NIES-50]